MSIQTSIELNDQFTNVIYGIINAVNLTVSAIEDMQHTMNADMGTSGIEGVCEEINQATMAMNELNAAMQNQPVINTDPPVISQISKPSGADLIPEQSRSPPTSAEIPLVWNTDNLDVFTGFGLERFQQEVQSANTMLERLSTTQNEIAQQVYNTNLLPTEAFQDLNRLAVRIDTIRERIRQIEKNPLNIGTDIANAELEQLRSHLNQAVQEQNELNTAMQDMDVSAANNAYMRLSQTVSNTERYIRDNVDEQGRFNQEIREGVSQADNLMNAIKGAVGAYVSIQTIGNIFNISDELVQATSRLNMMNDNVQTTEELMNMVYAAAQDARGSFGDMAAVVARFGNNAKDAFGSSAEVVAFADLVQKQMTIAGASTTEASNAMLQLSQGLGSGVLRGDELNSIFEQAPNLIQNIADYLEVPIGAIREMASEGELTADIVKAAVFSASDEINAEFEQIPMTWGQIWQSIQNTALIAFRPVLEKLNDFANSEAFQIFVNGVIEALAILANMALEVFSFLASCGQFVVDNWSMIKPIILGITGAFGMYIAVLTIYNTVQAISNALKDMAAFKATVHAAALNMEAGATFAATVQQYGFNAALAACPVTWIILAIITLISVIVMLCNWITEVTGTTTSAISIIVGALSVGAAFIGNLFIAFINMIMDIFATLWNFIAAFVNFLGNVFTGQIGSIERLFFDLVDTILSLLQTLAGAIDVLFGSNLANAVEGWRNNLSSWVDDIFGQGKEIMPTVSSEEWHVNRFEYGEAWDAGVAVGDGISSAIDGFSFSDIFGSVEIPNVQDYTAQFAEMGDNLDNISGDTSGISDALDITQEDLKYMRDLAEQEAINRYTTAEITIEQTNHNTVSGNMDLDGIVSGLTDAVDEAVEIVAGRGE